MLLILVYLNSISSTEMGNCCSCCKSCSKWIKKEEEKFEHLLDPTNFNVVEYCKTLIDASFHGETSNKVDEVTDHTEDKHEINLGSVLQSMDVEIRKGGTDFTGNEEEFLEYLHMAIKFRKPKGVSKKEYKSKVMKDKERFVELLNNRTGNADLLRVYSLKH